MLSKLFIASRSFFAAFLFFSCSVSAQEEQANIDIIGLNCAFSPLTYEFIPEVPKWLFHDASAVLLRNGQIVAAAEEERLNRLKHTNKFSAHALEYVLREGNTSINKIQRISFFFEENFTNKELNLQYIQYPHAPIKSAKELIVERINETFGFSISSDKIEFVKHHDAHAYSAFYQSGFDKALVVIVDGQGEDDSSMSVYSAENGKELKLLHTEPDYNSLGHFYSNLIQLLGYDLFDEYKVMGLAPYGDPSVYRKDFQELYQLLPEGKFSVKLSKIQSHFLKKGFIPRRKNEPFNQAHKDFAAALQESLEHIMLHTLEYWQIKTGHINLCLAGGVAHNCSMNGKIAYSGLFKRMFVHPAAHDAGAAIGAAMATYSRSFNEKIPNALLTSVYWGPHIGEDSIAIEKELSSWPVTYEKSSDICKATASLLAAGNVVAWAQDKSEFGPRALGNRSILADPRPAENKDRINAMVKKREAYRPFAPAILKEKVSEYFDLPKCEIPLDFMIFNLKIKEDKQALLGAITHVNGTGRVQTVDKKVNPLFWQLLKDFEGITGIPALLNTSFNNNAEPIVNSVHDCLTCFLTTGLDILVIDDFIIKKDDKALDNFIKNSIISLSPTAIVRSIQNSSKKKQYEIYFSHNSDISMLISENMYYFFLGEKNLLSTMIPEVKKIWANRMISLRPKVIYSDIIADKQL